MDSIHSFGYWKRAVGEWFTFLSLSKILYKLKKKMVFNSCCCCLLKHKIKQLSRPNKTKYSTEYYKRERERERERK